MVNSKWGMEIAFERLSELKLYATPVSVVFLKP